VVLRVNDGDDDDDVGYLDRGVVLSVVLHTELFAEAYL
jgi:hypothetical protein